jgi:hypothetical protein
MQPLSYHRINMELDFQSLFVLHVLCCTHCLRPRNPPPTFPPHEGAYDRRHLFVTLVPYAAGNIFAAYGAVQCAWRLGRRLRTSDISSKETSINIPPPPPPPHTNWVASISNGQYDDLCLVIFLMQSFIFSPLDGLTVGASRRASTWCATETPTGTPLWPRLLAILALSPPKWWVLYCTRIYR